MRINNVDPHTHSTISRHAHSSIWENAQCGAAAGLEAIAITDHFGLFLPWFEDARTIDMTMHIMPSTLPPQIAGIRVFAGVELDIVDIFGNLAGHDLDIKGYSGHNTALSYMLARRDVVIASLHYIDNLRDFTKTQLTQMYCNVLAKPGVHILGHCTRYGLDLDFAEIVAAAKEHGKLIEFNAASLRRDSDEQRALHIHLAELCAKTATQITICSDAHFCTNVGNFNEVENLLSEIDFPPELIASRDLASFEKALQKIKI
ncbi:MAG: PHP domain-containing protein [Defluviitaleaceae bacterium]|nr:PHP domain-containing protein [Defluviitaleaceae bacterium]